MSGVKKLTPDGRWLCVNGHDKNVVGVHRRNCALCHKKQSIASKKKKRREDPYFQGDNRGIPHLREVRMKLQLTQRELARLAQTSAAEISFIESGKRRPGRAVQKKIVKVIAELMERRRRVGLDI
jgi:DNA-binding XRE family transcriptional regulator